MIDAIMYLCGAFTCITILIMIEWHLPSWDIFTVRKIEDHFEYVNLLLFMIVAWLIKCMIFTAFLVLLYLGLQCLNSSLSSSNTLPQGVKTSTSLQD